MQIMKIFTLILVLMLGACTPAVEQNTYVDKSVLPEGLKDCTYYEFSTRSGSNHKGYNCPNSTTTTSYKSGKSTLHLVFVQD